MLFQLGVSSPGLASRAAVRRPVITAGTVSFSGGRRLLPLAHLAVIINFSLSYESAELRSWFNLTAYVNFCLRLLLIFGLVFELPVVAAILARLGLITARFLARQRKFAVLASASSRPFTRLITMVVNLIRATS